MSDPRGFLKMKRYASKYRPVCERGKDYEQVSVLWEEKKSREQAQHL